MCAWRWTQIYVEKINIRRQVSTKRQRYGRLGSTNPAMRGKCFRGLRRIEQPLLEGRSIYGWEWRQNWRSIGTGGSPQLTMKHGISQRKSWLWISTSVLNIVERKHVASYIGSRQQWLQQLTWNLKIIGPT